MEMTDEQIAKIMADPRVKKAIMEAVTMPNEEVTKTEIANNTLHVKVDHKIENPDESICDFALDVGKSCLKVAAIGAVGYLTVWGVAKALGPAIDVSEGGDTIDV